MPRRIALTAAVMTAISAAYIIVNHIHLRAPVLLPLSFVDRAVAFSPWAMPVYLSHFIFLPIALLTARSESVFFRGLKAMAIATALACVVFVAYPTTFPRVESAGFWFGLLNFIDTPANCFPSLHVAMAAIAAWVLHDDGRPWAPAAAVWAAAIIASTVLVKQHYAVDSGGGLLLAALSARLASRPAPEPVPAGEPA
ncbi:MAG: phosphatase PAP2 family protein [Elusimicrobia bacterium]|nr:phosphatase PAP2 family protein [Elusimicrobiota bacterium]